jgi:predicted metal-dependent hydrolase
MDNLDTSSLREALQQFNQQEFYTCHDLLEALWMDAYYPEKTFYQGLLQIAVGLYHLGDRNWKGSMILLGEGISRLRDFQPEYMDINVSKLIQDSAELLNKIQKSGKEELEVLTFKLPEIELIMQTEI